MTACSWSMRMTRWMMPRTGLVCCLWSSSLRSRGAREPARGGVCGTGCAAAAVIRRKISWSWMLLKRKVVLTYKESRKSLNYINWNSWDILPKSQYCHLKIKDYTRMGWKVHRLTMMQWSNLTDCGLIFNIVSPEVHTLPSVLQRLDSGGIEALILILEKSSTADMTSLVWYCFPAREQKIVRWCQIWGEGGAFHRTCHHWQFVIHWQVKWHSWFWLAMKHCCHGN